MIRSTPKPTLVLPRDAFNHAALLKCLGTITLRIEDGLAGNLQYGFLEYNHVLDYYEESTSLEDPTACRFEIERDEDGNIECANMFFYIGVDPDNHVRIYSPLNSRRPYPVLFGENCDFVFHEDGTFTKEFKNLINRT